MSRIGKQSLVIPAETEVAIRGDKVSVKGPKGELVRIFRPSDVSIEVKNSEVVVAPKRSSKIARALWGTYASHIANMILGVHEPFVKKLVVEGVGYRAEVAGSSLTLSVGYSHKVELPIPEGLSVSVEKNEITLSSIDKEVVGAFAARVRAVRKPEPYKGKGIRYSDEVIRRKQGKRAVT